jgi:hypothetical protein
VNTLRSLCVLLVTANIAVAIWLRWAPDEVRYAKPVTDPAVPGLVLRQEYLQLEQNKRRLEPEACWLIGPFASQKHMHEAWQSLEYVALDMQQRKTVQSLHQGYEVRIPPSASRAEALSLAEQLIASGVDGTRVVAQGPSVNAVSMGRFVDLAEAEKMQKLAQGLGLEAVLTSIQTEAVQWRIEATVRNQEGFDRWLIELTPKVPVQPCNAPEPASQNPPTRVQ